MNIIIHTQYFFKSRDDDGESRPVERAIEARTGSEDGQGSMVRCLHFAHTYIANRKNKTLIKIIHIKKKIFSKLIKSTKATNIFILQRKQFLRHCGLVQTVDRC